MSMIFVSGAGYTGSSAIVDYLSGFDGVKPIIKSRTESRLFSGSGGVSSVIKHLLKMKGGSSLNLDELRAVLLGSGGGSFDRKRNSAIKEVYGVGYTRSVDQFIEHLTLARDKSEDDVLFALIEGISKLYLFLKQEAGGDYLLINNDPPAFDFRLEELSSLFPLSYVIFVDRDPKDAYIDFVLDLGGEITSSTLVKKFLSRYNRGIRNASLVAKAVPNLIHVDFECFVTEKSVRDEIVKRIGFDGLVNSNSYFNSTDSSKNINKYKSYGNLDVFKYIDRNREFLCS